MVVDSKSQRESIRVCVRVRPPSQQEFEKDSHVCEDNGTSIILVDSFKPKDGIQRVTLHPGGNDRTFVMDRVFDIHATQEEVYEAGAKPIVESVLQGFNGAVLAYGQTSSGKTYTMEGPVGIDGSLAAQFFEDARNRDPINPSEKLGIIPRMVRTLFCHIENADEHIEFQLKVSILEIYNERLRDLIDPTKTNLRIREDKNRGIFVEDLSEWFVTTPQDVFDCIRIGQLNRVTAGTNMNAQSSRSHSIFCLSIQQRNAYDLSTKTSKLYLVDLAGSEKVAKTGAEGQTLDEAKMINKSLASLGNVINALTSTGSKSISSGAHIPYRDSKLTRVLERRSLEAVERLLAKAEEKLITQSKYLKSLEFLLKSNGFELPILNSFDSSSQPPSNESSPIPSLSDKSDVVLLPETNSARVVAEVLELQEEISIKNMRLKEQSQEMSDLKLQVAELSKYIKRNMPCQRDSIVTTMLKNLATTPTKQILENDDAVKVVTTTSRLLPSFEEDNSTIAQQEVTNLKLELRNLQQVLDDERRRTKTLRAICQNADKPLQEKLEEIDELFHRLTTMYQEVVDKNSGLKLECKKSADRIEQKNRAIVKLEANFFESRQKYSDLLETCQQLSKAVANRSSVPSSEISSNGNDTVLASGQLQPLDLPSFPQTSKSPILSPHDQSATTGGLWTFSLHSPYLSKRLNIVKPLKGGGGIISGKRNSFLATLVGVGFPSSDTRAKKNLFTPDASSTSHNNENDNKIKSKDSS